MPRLRFPAASGAALLLIALISAPATAQSPAPSPSDPPAAPSPEPAAAPLVGSIVVEGNVAADVERVIRSFEVTSGSRYSDEAVRRGIRKLFALGLFTDVWVTRTERDGRVDLVIHVVERRRITAIEFTGQRKKDEDELRKKLFVRIGESFSPVQVRTQVDTLLKIYREDGYAQASIDAVPDTTAGPGRLTLRFVIREGEKVKIARIVFEGRSAFPEKRLRKVMRTKQKGLLGGGEVDDEHFAENKEKLEAWYQNHGFRDARVVGHELLPGRQPRKLVLKVTLDEGRRYTFGNVSWEGNQVLASAEVEKLWKPKPGDTYDLSRLDRVRGEAYGEYAEKGYLFVRVEAAETPRDSIVDVKFQVEEGVPSNVRYVRISGNKGTREKVIRREIDIHEGDRFRRSALVRSRDDIMRLGIFEDVGVDFATTETSDVDVLLKVKEKQVGTASAGAGYTNEAGLTGFIELGHNNVLGNAQSLQLRLERGSQRQDYYVAFTEPWFRDTPTLLGFSAFNSETERDLYVEKRVGGSARIGRPLPWPDFSRGSMSYQLEGVEIDSIGTLNDADRAALAGVAFGKRLTTSSLSLGFVRNSTDNPFYPTRGTRLTLSTELAGGIMGGGVTFHKHRAEGRVYLPSFTKAVTSMLRARLGVVGDFGNAGREAPLYERFRLGGGTTMDPLRGYDDYQVVPSKYNRFVPVQVFVRNDTTPGTPVVVTPVYRTEGVRVRYPGGNFMSTLTFEQQFPIVHPLHGVVFFDAGNVWNLWREITPLDLKTSAGFGFRLEIPLLGNIGLDWGYGFQRDDGPKAATHFLLGNVNF